MWMTMLLSTKSSAVTVCLHRSFSPQAQRELDFQILVGEGGYVLAYKMGWHRLFFHGLLTFMNTQCCISGPSQGGLLLMVLGNGMMLIFVYH